jgi:hypothetical protein
MRELVTSLLLVTCLLPVGAGAMRLSASLAEDSAPHAFAHLNSEPLWSSEVKRIDPSLQAYERLPAVPAADTMVAEEKSTKRVYVTAPGVHTLGNQMAGDETLADFRKVRAREWCGERYRSFDPTDNSYQPYGGGPRRVCVPPTEARSPVVTQVADADIVPAQTDAARWCMERYSSYRIEDNSYQPFSGGRRHCPGPGAQSASNSTREPATGSIVRF